jgi:hypothetical protein
MGDPDKGSAIKVGVDRSGARAEISNRALTRVGDAAAWLFPKQAARVRITQALAERTAERIRSGQDLDEQERAFVAQLFKKEARAIANQNAAAERIREVLPEIEVKMQALPPVADRGTTSDFVARAESLAGEITDEQVRDLFSRVLAGEVCRPGSFTLKTLETVRLLDQNVARLFQTARCLALDGDHIIHGSDGFLESHGLALDERLELVDAGLIDIDSIGLSIKAKSLTQWSYGDFTIKLDNVSGYDRWIDIVRFTRVGRELASVVHLESSEAYVRAVVSDLAGRFESPCVVSWRRAGEPEWTVAHAVSKDTEASPDG